MEKNAILTQINEFGQTPKQLFKIAHPKKFSSSKIPLPMTTDSTKEKKSSSEACIYLESKILGRLTEKDFSHQIFKRIHKGEINDLVILNGNLITLGSDFFVKVHKGEDMTTIKSFKICNFNLSCISKIDSADVVAVFNNVIKIGSWDNHIYFYNMTFGTIVNKFEAHVESVTTLAYSVQKNVELLTQELFTSSLDCSVKSFKINKKNYQLENEVIRFIQNIVFDNEYQINSILLLEKEELVVIGDNEGNVKFIDINSSSQVISLKLSHDKIKILKNMQNKIIAASHFSIYLLDKKGNIISEFKITSSNGVISSIQIIGRLIVVFTDKGHVGVFDSLIESFVGHLFHNYEKIGDQTIDEDFFFNSSCTSESSIYVGCKNGSVMIIN